MQKALEEASLSASSRKKKGGKIYNVIIRGVNISEEYIKVERAYLNTALGSAIFVRYINKRPLKGVECFYYPHAGVCDVDISLLGKRYSTRRN